ncbi:N-acetyltransferase [Apostasia shenzhenica]|uniref:N-acetyltransferase n=1 Tax=Apostasia shenzhenica TaxID=1088818 RepID=A0A2I0AW47_9ASPA|nr:N-acetyltransferase [Apostasia shenzhenica]
MDPMSSSFGRVLLEEITPVVMVLSTSLAEEACQKNGLSFVEMLHPFSLFNKIDVPVRTASDQPYRLQMFNLRLVYACDLHQQHFKVAEDQLKQLVSHSAKEALTDLQSEPSELETVMKKNELNLCTSWIQSFNRGLRRTVSFSEHEALDHPVACLLVVSSKDEQPISRYVDLFNTDQLPSLLNEGAMDPKILKEYLLLHDNHDGTLERATGILTEMRSTFGPADCKLLCINSAAGVSGQLEDDPWLSQIKDFMQELASKHIIPYMEQKIRSLNQQVSATRKGFRNQIKNLWWRKGKEDIPEAASGLTYTFSSIESQIRVLGDYAFMLRDYELALSNYRLLSTDYKLDKAWKRYAGVQEMMGLAYFMLDQSRKDAESCLEIAFNTYLKLGPAGQRNATRCGLWWAEMLKVRGQYKEAAGIYFRISNEESPLHAAVMLEQASYSYLFCKPPMLRKYGFHLVLAGNRYYVSDQKPHALRTFRDAFLIYKGIPWNYIRDHIHYSIGRWYAFIGILDLSVKHMLEVLACSHQPKTTQDLFLSSFFQIVESTGKKFDGNKLQLPAVNLSSIKVIYEDHRTYASSSDVGINENKWQSLEEEMVPSVPTIKLNWLESQSKLSLKKYNDYHICVVGEAIKVDIEFRNPLQIPISVFGISLMCDLSSRSEETEIRSRNADSSSLIFSELDLVLDGGETKRVQLECIPKVEGILKVVGVKWKLSGLVVGYQYFEPHLKKKLQKGKLASKRSSGSILSFIVIKGLPKLEGCVHNFPGSVFAGDLRLLTLELRNQSEYSVKNMKMTVSHPRFLIPGNLECLHLEFPNCLEKRSGLKTNDGFAVVQKSKNLLFSFPNDVSIRAGETFLWPLFIHIEFSGKVSLFLSVYYEVENYCSDMIYRTLRMHYDVEVLPSLDVSFQIAPCPSNLQEFLVRMDIMNKTSTENFSLRQLSCVGDHMEISSLPTYEYICPSKILLAGQALSCFFKLKNCTKSDVTESKIAIYGRDVPLALEGTMEPLIDVSASPLVDFHQREKYHQGRLLEGGTCDIDFILISELLQNNSIGPQRLLLSNHACHCSITTKTPIWWLMEGPRSISHDFSKSFCEVDLELTICNCSKNDLSVKVITSDVMPETKHSGDSISDSNTNQGGWHDMSLSDIEASSSWTLSSSSSSSQSLSPFIWCAASSTQVKLKSSSSAKVPLRICVFSPGTYDLSNYEMHWSLMTSKSSHDGISEDMTASSSGMSRGLPYYLTVM